MYSRAAERMTLAPVEGEILTYVCARFATAHTTRLERPDHQLAPCPNVGSYRLRAGHARPCCLTCAEF